MWTDIDIIHARYSIHNAHIYKYIMHIEMRTHTHTHFLLTPFSATGSISWKKEEGSREIRSRARQMSGKGTWQQRQDAVQLWENKAHLGN